MLKGHSPQAISKELNVCDATVYNDIKALTEKSKKYLFDLAKGTHVLMYQKVIDGVSLVLSNSWNKFHDPATPEKTKVSYLRLIKDCNESLFSLFDGGPSALSVHNSVTRTMRLELGFYDGSNTNPKYPPLTDEQKIADYANSSESLDKRYECLKEEKARIDSSGGNGNREKGKEKGTDTNDPDRLARTMGKHENETWDEYWKRRWKQDAVSDSGSNINNTSNLGEKASTVVSQNEDGNGKVLTAANDPALTTTSTASKIDAEPTSAQSAQPQSQVESKSESESKPKSKQYFYDFTNGSITKV